MSIAAAREALDELTRQLVLERRYAVLAPLRGGRPPEIAPEVREAFRGFDAELCTFPELEPLLAVADRVLVLSDGLVFSVALLRLVFDGQPLVARLPLERLVGLGALFSGFAGSIGGQRMAIRVHVYELHPEAFPEAWERATRPYRRRGVGTPAVGVAVTALDASSGRLWGNAPLIPRVAHGRLLRRCFLERQMPEARRRALLARSGFQPSRALLGGAAGAVLGLGLTRLFLSLYVTEGDLYVGAALIACLIGALISLRSCRICRRTIEQSMAGGLGALGGIFLGWWWLRMPLTAGLVVLAALVAFAGFAVGFAADPRRR